jgi:hypothetical protein
MYVTKKLGVCCWGLGARRQNLSRLRVEKLGCAVPAVARSSQMWSCVLLVLACRVPAGLVTTCPGYIYPLRTEFVSLALAACANSNKSPPRDPRDPPSHSWRGLVHTNHTRCAESRNGCIQRIFGPPSDPEIRHVALAAVPAANLKPGTRPEPAPALQPPTEGTDGIRPAPGGAAPPTRVRGGWCNASRRKAGEGRGGLSDQIGRPSPRFTPVPEAAIG